ncbi:hypothetical protein FSP39_009449 [Pinctada imbricata]|uniref:Prokineticin domain-containing protein n=1 Tax=Pinctada imbricata TaxID=66713 RepID=A0AA88Y1Y6_PINIB|nr:hypothetical protein FSP39_009449 [Pinctada imbricata]
MNLLFLCDKIIIFQSYCLRNEDCGHADRLCCSVTPSLGKRQVDANFMVHYCLPYKTENATWCDLHLQYSPEQPFYLGLCPCGPGLTCGPTDELNPKYYPRERYGKCKKSV